MNDLDGARVEVKPCGCNHVVTDDQDKMASDQLKKDWVVMLASTSGVMLTVCLAALSVIYSSSTTALASWQKIVGSLPILVSACLLMDCSVKSLHSLGALIMAVEKDRSESVKAMLADAKSAQALFVAGIKTLVIAILVIIIVFNWSFFTSLCA